MAAPVRSVSDMSDNPKTINRSGVYIYNDRNLMPVSVNGFTDNYRKYVQVLF